jgi:hypothetical protein
MSERGWRERRARASPCCNIGVRQTLGGDLSLHPGHRIAIPEGEANERQPDRRTDRQRRPKNRIHDPPRDSLKEYLCRRVSGHRIRLSRFEGATVQHAAQATVQPCLGGGVVVLGIDRFVVDRCGVATGADDLLRPPALSGGP